MNIIWLINDVSFEKPVNRLRCFHFARFFYEKYAFNSIITTEGRTAQSNFHLKPILIINNILNPSILETLYEASDQNLPIIFDLHDIPPTGDLLNHILDYVDLISVPSWKVKTALAADELKIKNNYLDKIKVVPDFAEDKFELIQTLSYFQDYNPLLSSSHINGVLKAETKLTKIYRALNEQQDTENSILLLEYPYASSNLSSFSPLKKHLSTLKKLQEIHKFDLFVFAFPATDYSILDQLQINYTLVEYNLVNLITLIQKSLLSFIAYSGDIRSHQTSSNFKELLSLSLSTPVVSVGSDNNIELLDVNLPSIKDGIPRIFNDPDSTSQILYKYGNISDRFSLESISKLYYNLICRICVSKKANSALSHGKSCKSNISIFCDYLNVDLMLKIYLELSIRDINIKFVHTKPPSLNQLIFTIRNQLRLVC